MLRAMLREMQRVREYRGEYYNWNHSKSELFILLWRISLIFEIHINSSSINRAERVISRIIIATCSFFPTFFFTQHTSIWTRIIVLNVGVNGMTYTYVTWLARARWPFQWNEFHSSMEIAFRKFRWTITTINCMVTHVL